jgi:hypothetical protein
MKTATTFNFTALICFLGMIFFICATDPILNRKPEPHKTKKAPNKLERHIRQLKQNQLPPQNEPEQLDIMPREVRIEKP